MSKTVIVFSTRFINPLVEAGLFSHSEPIPFTSNALAEFFWNDIKKDNNYLESLLKHDYLANEPKEGLICFLNDNQDQLEYVVTNSKLDHSFSTNDFNWIGDLLSKRIDFPQKADLRKKYLDYQKSVANTNKIMQEDNLVLCKKLKKNISQKPFNLDPIESGFDGPWLSYRFSYYELYPENDNVGVYAVWPLQYNCPQKDGKYQWVDALTEQFLTKLNPNAKELYLILHDKDIKGSLFQVIIDDMTGTASRHVALFQHVDEIGRFLENPSDRTPEGVKSFVEEKVTKARILKLLCDAYDYITNNNIDQLGYVATELHKFNNKKYNAIHEIVETINNCGSLTASSQQLVKLKLDLIRELNLKLKDYMIINES